MYTDTTVPRNEEDDIEEQEMELFLIHKKQIEEAIRLLSGGMDINGQFEDGCTLLHIAVMNGNFELVKMLIEMGANIDATDAFGRTPLFYAIVGGHGEITRYLLNKGADLRLALSTMSLADIYSALHSAVLNGNFDIAKIILGNISDMIKFANKIRVSPLHKAALQGDQDLVIKLIGKGMDINLKDSLGFTPLYYAMLSGNKQLVDMMVEKGAVLNPGDDKPGLATEREIIKKLLIVWEKFVRDRMQENTKKKQSLKSLAENLVKNLYQTVKSNSFKLNKLSFVAKWNDLIERLRRQDEMLEKSKSGISQISSVRNRVDVKKIDTLRPMDSFDSIVPHVSGKSRESYTVKCLQPDFGQNKSQDNPQIVKIPMTLNRLPELSINSMTVNNLAKPLI